MDPASPFRRAVQWQQEHRISASIVASSLEMSYIHFGALGIIAFGVFTGIGLNFAHEKLYGGQRYFLLTSLLLTHALTLVRGTPSYVLLQLLVTTIAYSLYHATLRLADRGVRKAKRNHLN
jgi:hypothetical protein